MYEAQKKYYKKNRERIKQYYKEYFQQPKVKEKNKIRRRQWLMKPENYEKEMQYRKANKDKINTRKRKWCKESEAYKQWLKKYQEENKEALKRYSKEWWLQNKIKAIGHYSNGTMKCACCGEDNIGFLTLDHINGGGRKHRISLGTKSLWRWVIKNNFPKEPPLQVLCFNCNCGKNSNNGICPHKTKKEDMVEEQDKSPVLL